VQARPKPAGPDTPPGYMEEDLCLHSSRSEALFGLWQVQDSNLRRHTPADLQNATAHPVTCTFTGHQANFRANSPQPEKSSGRALEFSRRGYQQQLEQRPDVLECVGKDGDSRVGSSMRRGGAGWHGSTICPSGRLFVSHGASVASVPRRARLVRRQAWTFFPTGPACDDAEPVS